MPIDVEQAKKLSGLATKSLDVRDSILGIESDASDLGLTIPSNIQSDFDDAKSSLITAASLLYDQAESNTKV